MLFWPDVRASHGALLTCRFVVMNRYGPGSAYYLQNSVLSRILNIHSDVQDPGIGRIDAKEINEFHHLSYYCYVFQYIFIYFG